MKKKPKKGEKVINKNLYSSVKAFIG